MGQQLLLPEYFNRTPVKVCGNMGSVPLKGM